jgi:uncharacterized membrane protein YsdA (DUF1294 family)
MDQWLWLLGWYALASVVTFATFGFDKFSARSGSRRIPERTLHAMEFVGGWPGAIAAILWLRHKSSKPPFLLLTFAIMALHIAVLGAILLR